MMSGFRAKLLAAVVAVFLLVGDIPTTSAILPLGGRKSLWVVQGRDVSMKVVVPREEGSSEGLNTVSKKIVSFWGIRAKVLPSPPPPPIRNRQSSWRTSTPPPQSL